MSKPIVVGIDNIPGGRDALDWAVAESRSTSVPLMLLHADVPAQSRSRASVSAGGAARDDDQTHARQVAADAVRYVVAQNRDVRISSVVFPGEAADVLVRWSTDASLIVLGNRGGKIMSKALLDTVSGMVSAQSQCPVVVVRVPVPKRAPVVVGVDGSPRSEAAIMFAFDYATRHDTWVRALHAWHRSSWNGSGTIAGQRTAHEHIVAEAVANAQAHYPKTVVRPSCPIGPASKLLTEESMDAQLVVIGTRGDGFGSGVLLGSVSQSLLRQAQCPVAVIPHGNG
jgi:nucleotide-binding universal stress UspA family protein